MSVYASLFGCYYVSNLNLLMSRMNLTRYCGCMGGLPLWEDGEDAWS